jgi:hypothetical protein
MGLSVLLQAIVYYTKKYQLKYIAFIDQELEYTKDKQISPKDTAMKSEKQLNVNLASKLTHIVSTLLYMMQITMSNLLMLIIMTMNASLFISILMGSGIGYLLFNY